MAINLNCNLNGGDTVTPNNELFYRIYGDVDNYAAPIHTTGTAIADANVTVNGDVVDILNIDETTNTGFKIAAVDGAGNEGVLSDAKSSSLEYNFDGTTLDTNEWLLKNANPGTVSLSQNNHLLLRSLQSTGAVSRANGFEMVREFTSGTFEFEYSQATNVSNGGIILWDGTKFAGFILEGSNSNLTLRTYSSDDTGQITAISWTGKRLRLIFTGTEITFGYSTDGGTNYTDIETLAFTPAASTVKLYANQANSIGAPTGVEDCIFDNLTISNYTEV